jgi:ABC-2 type transport system ATP-binding protein
LKQVEPALADRVRQFAFVKNVEIEDSRLILALDDPETANPIIVKALVEAGAEVQFIGEVRHSLEDVYLSLIDNK